MLSQFPEQNRRRDPVWLRCLDTRLQLGFKRIELGWSGSSAGIDWQARVAQILANRVTGHPQLLGDSPDAHALTGQHSDFH